ncbi:MAG: molybdopterin molybdenumtransferase MoeA [Gammaproteobacteria bacterium]|nr:molybdopterin molybdenumtransferase MoeA [Gammaproteobacteria bacterium]
MSDQILIRESCQDATDSALSVEAALDIIVRELAPLSGQRITKLKAAAGNLLAAPVVSPMNVPAHRNSAMDGYALRGDDLPASGTAELSLAGTAYAGKPFPGVLKPGECIRIMTGAKMPEAADTVVIQEQAEQHGDRIRIDSHNKPGQNVRQAGEDITAGSVVLSPGQNLGAAQLGLLASLGISEVSVRVPLRVAFFSSGDEIKGLGESLEAGQIYDSNRYTLYGMLKGLGADIIDMGIVPDREAMISEALSDAASHAHLVLTSGGVSVGEADYIALALQRLGTTYFSKVAIKPGRPLTFGRIGETPFFGLPGNPVAVMITFLQFVVPGIRRLRGEPTWENPSFEVVSRSRLRKVPGRTEFQRGILERGVDGVMGVRTTGRQGSGVLSSMSMANCLIVLPAQRGSIEPGETVMVQPFALFPGL